MILVITVALELVAFTLTFLVTRFVPNRYRPLPLQLAKKLLLGQGMETNSLMGQSWLAALFP
jgi:hypothetical protein